MNRRSFLRLSAGAVLLAPGVASSAAEGGPKRLVVILLRGAVDGLNVVIPHGERGGRCCGPRSGWGGTLAVSPAGRGPVVGPPLCRQGLAGRDRPAGADGGR